VSGLSTLLTGANAGRLSGRAIARLARDRGHTLNHDTAARYLRGDHGTPDEATLIAFADVLNIPMTRLRAAAGLPSDATAPYVPPPEASRLSRRQRRAVDEIIRAMVEPPAAAAETGTVADLAERRDGGKRRPTRRAARHGEPEQPVD
jgi:transcriptional regulator with XRE-family HTH domain